VDEPYPSELLQYKSKGPQASGPTHFSGEQPSHWIATRSTGIHHLCNSLLLWKQSLTHYSRQVVASTQNTSQPSKFLSSTKWSQSQKPLTTCSRAICATITKRSTLPYTQILKTCTKDSNSPRPRTTTWRHTRTQEPKRYIQQAQDSCRIPCTPKLPNMLWNRQSFELRPTIQLLPVLQQLPRPWAHHTPSMDTSYHPQNGLLMVLG
jgi:hypothetical protein